MSEHNDDPFPVGCRVRYEEIWPTGEYPTGTVIPLAKFAPNDGRRTVQWDDERVSTEGQSWLTRIDSEPDPADPDTWPLAETWEDCARHVEAGGVVESAPASLPRRGMTSGSVLTATGTAPTPPAMVATSVAVWSRPRVLP